MTIIHPLCVPHHRNPTQSNPIQPNPIQFNPIQAPPKSVAGGTALSGSHFYHQWYPTNASAGPEPGAPGTLLAPLRLEEGGSWAMAGRGIPSEPPTEAAEATCVPAWTPLHVCVGARTCVHMHVRTLCP